MADIVSSRYNDVAGQAQKKSVFHDAGAFIQPCSQAIWVRHFSKICIKDEIVLIGLIGLPVIIEAQSDGGPL
jgi:hypothetical protein